MKKQDLDLKAAQEALDESDRLRAKEIRDRKRLEKKVTLLTEELQAFTLGTGSGAESERLKSKNKGTCQSSSIHIKSCG